VQLAYDALHTGGTAPAVLNAANEVSVALFLDRKISFDQIPVLIRQALDHHRSTPSPSLDDIIAADGETRHMISRIGNQTTMPAIHL
jgi:1-deoxy-D-xylulose-5-phosphate reductoisomerase